MGQVVNGLSYSCTVFLEVVATCGRSRGSSLQHGPTGLPGLWTCAVMDDRSRADRVHHSKPRRATLRTLLIVPSCRLARSLDTVSEGRSRLKRRGLVQCRRSGMWSSSIALPAAEKPSAQTTAPCLSPKQLS